MEPLLSIADRVSRISPVNNLVNKLVDRIAPKAIAKACYGTCLIYQGACSNHQREMIYGFRYFSHGSDGSVVVTCVNPCSTTLAC